MLDVSQCVVGIDLGDRTAVACVYAAGTIVEWLEFPMTPAGVQGAFEGKGFARIAMEAGGQSGWVTRLLRTLGYEPVVANPRKLKAISANERKCDHRDAVLLAKLVWADPSLLHPIHHRSAERALALTVLQARDALVQARTKLINTIRAMSKATGVRLTRGSADTFVKRQAEVPPELAPAVGGLFTALATLTEQIDAYDKQLTQMMEESFPEAKRVNQVRGVGPITALAFVLTLEDPTRYANGRTAAAFLGLVPRRDQSGAVDRQLPISKTGNNFLRRMLVQCAQYILGPLGRDCDLRRWGHSLAERGGKNAKKRSIVATARKLAVLLFRLWKTAEPWIPLHNSQPTEAPVSGKEPPEPAVPDDCAFAFDATGNREPRGIDCSTDDGSDPSMHRADTGPTKSADRSVGAGRILSTQRANRPPRRAPAMDGAEGQAREPGPAARPRTPRATRDRKGPGGDDASS